MEMGNCTNCGAPIELETRATGPAYCLRCWTIRDLERWAKYYVMRKVALVWETNMRDKADVERKINKLREDLDMAPIEDFSNMDYEDLIN